MFIINSITKETATGAVKKVYSMFPEGVPVPAPLQLYSASPRYLLKQAAIISDYMKDDAYDVGLLAALRYIGASTSCFEACTRFNKDYLMRMGLTESEIESLSVNPSQSFDEKEAALLALVSKAVADPDSVNRDDIDTVCKHGWTEQQIFECTAYAAQMATVGIVFRTFSG